MGKQEHVPETKGTQSNDRKPNRAMRRHPEKVDPTETARQLKRAGVDHLLVRTDRPFAADLRQFFKSRNLLGRGAR